MPYGTVLADKQQDSYGATLAPVSVPFRNRILNGQMVIDQRNAGASVTTSTAGSYTIDRFTVGISAVNGTSQRIATGNTNFPYALRLTGASGSTVCWVGQRIESNNCSDLVGNSITVSAVLSASAITSVAVNIKYPSTVDNWTSTNNLISTQNITINSTATSYSVTFTNLPSGVSNGLYVEFVPNSNLGTGTFTVTGVQLEKGGNATSFDYRPYGTELQLCQRYYQKYTQPALRGVINPSSGNIALRVGMVLPVVMRSAPSPVMGSLGLFDGTTVANVTSISADYSTATVVEYDLNLNVGLTGRAPALIIQNGVASLALSSEL